LDDHKKGIIFVVWLEWLITLAMQSFGEGAVFILLSLEI
jgi:hypothetical protein